MYQNQSKEVMKVKATTLCNQLVQTDTTISNNKPEIHNNKQGTCMLINAAIPRDRNVIKKAKKILKYKDLITEIQRMWIMKVKAIPAITGASGTISKSLRQYLSNIAGKHKIKNFKKKGGGWHIGH